MMTGANQAQQNIPKVATLNERLNRAAQHLQDGCDRLESILSRVNGTPQPQTQGQAVGKLAQINPTLPLSTVVEHLEAVELRLAELVNNAENIA